ncbi:MAG: Spy/CpxP family protein refolding chaperone [Proteobacteria bacterium]|nr:Spy/CpxP family protein refolding chaperone [Pseudomonadota bacterium]
MQMFPRQMFLRHTFLRQTLFATVAVFGLGATAATAATSAAPMSPPAASQAMPSAQPPAAATAKPPTMAERVDRRIADLHSALKITPAQAPQWRRFTAVMRENARDIDHAMHVRVDRLPSMNAEQNMQSYAHIAAIHAEGMRKLVPAFEHLYAAMSPAQKQTVDQVFRNDAYRGAAAHHH